LLRSLAVVVVEGHLRPDEALQHLQLYKSKFAQLKEERDNVAKAKEALELQELGKLLHILAVVVVKGCLRPVEALQHLQMYESKFARLKEEQDSVAKAKKALEIQEPGKLLLILMVVVVEGHLRPVEALQHLQMYESKFARLKEE